MFSCQFCEISKNTFPQNTFGGCFCCLILVLREKIVLQKLQKRSFYNALYFIIFCNTLYFIVFYNTLIAVGYCAISQFLTCASCHEADPSMLKHSIKFEPASGDSFVYLFPDIFRGFFNPISDAFRQSPGITLPESSSESTNPWGV